MKFGNQEFSTGSNSDLSVDRTVNLLTSDTTAQKQAKIDDVPKVASGGASVTFQFEDGTHTETATLNFKSFTYPITIQGNPSDSSSLSTAQSVHVDSSGVSGNAFLIAACVKVTFQKMKVTCSSSSGYSGIRFDQSSAHILLYNYFLGNSTSSGYGLLYSFAGCGLVFNCYFSNVQYGIRADGTRIASQTNDDTGTQPAYGLWASGAGTIGKTGTQITGSTSDELSTSGGTIRA